MRLISPNALWFLMLIPPFILMYILKQTYEEKQVPSLYLWQQVIMDLDATSPFQRLKNNILFFLQLIILLLAIFALTNPFIWWKNNNFENVVMVVDNSGSMSAFGEKNKKLEEAREKAEELVNSLSAGTKMTLISTSANFKVEVSGSTDRKLIINKLKAIPFTNSAGSLEDTHSLIKAICDQYKSYKVVYFTDSMVDLKELKGEVIQLGPQRPNVSLDYIAHTNNGNELKVMIRVTNHGTDTAEPEICLYGDERLISIKNEVLNSGETKTVYFDHVPADNEYIYGELSDEDGLMEDNRMYSVIRQKQTKRILLSTEQNVFIEKALNTLKDIELFKTLPDEKIDTEFDLYIFDGDPEGELPETGSILFLNPQKDNSYFKAGQEINGGKADISPHAITKYMNNSDFVISKLNSVEMPYWASSLLEVNEQPAAFAGEVKGQKVGVIGFDLHNSDFPLTLEFPIFINNFISYLIDRDTIGNQQYFCGEKIEINPLPEAEEIFVKNPGGQKTSIGSKYPVKPYDETSLPGIYEVTQKVGDKEVEKLVAVNFPVSESGTNDIANSDIRASDNNNNPTGEGTIDEDHVKDSGSGGLNLLNMLLMAALLIIAVEWAVYVRQYKV